MRLFQAILAFSVLAILAPLATAQDSEKPLPKIVGHSEPNYPPLCRQARISGDVLVRFTTDGQLVITAEAETGHPLLRQAAEENVRTWKFTGHERGTFHVTFQYKIQSGPDIVAFLASPAVVEIATSPPIAIIDNCGSIDLGKWRAHLSSALGSSQLLIQMYTGEGCGEHSLNGEVTGTHGQKEEIDLGYYDLQQGMFGFTVMLSHPKRKSGNTFFIGKIRGDKLTGAFVDTEGITGRWTAIREK